MTKRPACAKTMPTPGTMKCRWLPVPTSVLVARSRCATAVLRAEISLPFAEYVSTKGPEIGRAKIRTGVPAESKWVVKRNVPWLW